MTWIYHYAVAVYRDDRGCGQVSTIDGSTGRRGPARSSYADPRVRLSSDGTTVLSAGDTRLEMWRSDMVRMMAYGETDARVKPSARGLHSGCTLESAAASSSAVSVLEACANQADLRLVLLRPGKEDDEPQQHVVPEPGIRPGTGARVLVVSQNNTAVYLPTPQPRVDVIDETGTTRVEHAAGQAAVGVGGGVAERKPDDLVDRRCAAGVRREQPEPALHHRRGRHGCTAGAGRDDGGRAAGAGHRRDRGV